MCNSTIVMSDYEEFWSAVEELNYIENGWKFRKCWEKAHVFLLRRYSEDKIKQFYNILNELAAALHPKFDKFDKYDIYGDTRDDAASLAVSLGKDQYFQLMSDDDAFEQFILLYDDVHYYESFKYCFLLSDEF